VKDLYADSNQDLQGRTAEQKRKIAKRALPMLWLRKLERVAKAS
jgi:hypothetical protein